MTIQEAKLISIFSSKNPVSVLKFANIAAVLKATESKIVPKRVGRYTRFKVVLSFIVLKKSFIIYYIGRKNTLY